MATYSVTILKPNIINTNKLFYSSDVVKNICKNMQKNKINFKVFPFFNGNLNLDEDILNSTEICKDFKKYKCKYTDNGIKITFTLDNKCKTNKLLQEYEFIAGAVGSGEVTEYIDKDTNIEYNKVTDYILDCIIIYPRIKNSYLQIQNNVIEKVNNKE